LTLDFDVMMASTHGWEC